MIHIKNQKEQKIMRESGKILSEVLKTVVKRIDKGISELEIDSIAESEIIKRGGKPGFKLVPGYKHSVCVATNEVVVHGIPTEYKYKTGDIACVDCGVYYEGFHTDMAETVIIDEKNAKIQKDYKKKRIFLDTGLLALNLAIEQAKEGNRVGDISRVIQDTVERKGGYSIVRSLVGHGVGKKLHEEPEIPGYLNSKIEKTPLLKNGMTIAIEIIYNMGKRDVEYKGGDGWTIKTADNSLSAVFERTVLISGTKPEILTNLK